MEPAISPYEDPLDPIEFSPPPIAKRARVAEISWNEAWLTRFREGSCAFQTTSFPYLGLLNDAVKEVAHLLTVNPPIKIFGKPGIQHRNVGFFSLSESVVNYNYSTGNHLPAQRCPLALELLMSTMNTAFGPKARFNAVLVNAYKDGNDYIGAHSDKEEFIDPEVGVFSLSAGITRTFRIRDKATKKVLCDVPLQHGQLAVMSGRDFQTRYTHEILKEPSVKMARFSFTFRHHKAQ